MKSLEILEHIKNAPSFMGGDDRYKNNIQSHWVFLEDVETIKQDLEVLEIFYKLFGDMEIDTYEWDGKKRAAIRFIGSDFCVYAHNEEQALQYIKLKQWLEENENGSNK